MRELYRFPPDWADAWGDDRFGLWAECSVDAARQRLRWIEPGEFMMGSPADEPGRYDVEGPRHRVRVSAGFWMADTACTQAFWVAVMRDDNPSRFADDPWAPVERVSWNDAQRFLQKLAFCLDRDAAPVLPTEAQWEYACRAGTVTPFNLGWNVSPQTVNYDGSRGYNRAPSGHFRARTVAVKTLPPNAWGLYEMHGNVWEWCADGLRDYVAEDKDDPVGTQDASPEARRAVRGGSWFFGARSARSAYRHTFRRDMREHYLGFRWCLRR